MEKTKKQFQKVIGSIRKDRNTAENINSNFPKAMMTYAQMEKKQATVNCGGEWSTAEKTKQIVELVLNDSRFIKFLSDNSATAKTEYNNFGSFQIRIYF